MHSDLHDTPYSDSPAAEGAIARARRGPLLRRRWVWVLIAVVVLLLLVVTPPLINANRYRGKIAETMSRSLGRPVHLDNVSLHLLPVPGFTLQNLVVSEAPEFGSEPTIRANTVEATLRVSSLWHHPVEFSTVRFVEPSVNLVRNAQGRWNLTDVLLQASRVESAPTVQRHPGPKPRFPYIEATSGRVNIKLGAEKQPFSLADADFALWLPSPQQWRVRLIGQPARTDTNITDPGRIRIEGELHRAASAADIPVSFTASWHDAPLGEATRILARDDWGWRGLLNLDATLEGTLGHARMSSKLTLGGLRRAEFFPSRPLDLQFTCGSGFALHPATLTQLRCTLPDNAPDPMRLQAETIHLQGMRTDTVSLVGQAVPVRWALLWAALFSPRVPVDLHPAGTLDVNLLHGPLPAVVPAAKAAGAHGRRAKQPQPVALPATTRGWSGTVQLRTFAPGSADGTTAEPSVLVGNVVPPAAPGKWPLLRLAPTPLELGPQATVTLTGNVGENGYTFSATGTAPAAALLQPARYLPELGDGLEKVLPFPPTSTEGSKVQFTCTRTWATAQTCTGPGTGSAGRSLVVPVGGAPGGNTPATGQVLPSALAPRNLSPLENAPFSTPRPTGSGSSPR